MLTIAPCVCVRVCAVKLKVNTIEEARHDPTSTLKQAVEYFSHTFYYYGQAEAIVCGIRKRYQSFLIISFHRQADEKSKVYKAQLTFMHVDIFTAQSMTISIVYELLKRSRKA